MAVTVHTVYAYLSVVLGRFLLRDQTNEQEQLSIISLAPTRKDWVRDRNKDEEVAKGNNTKNIKNEERGGYVREKKLISIHT